MPVRDRSRDFSLPSREAAEHDENRDHEDKNATLVSSPSTRLLTVTVLNA